MFSSRFVELQKTFDLLYRFVLLCRPLLLTWPELQCMGMRRARMKFFLAQGLGHWELVGIILHRGLEFLQDI